MAIYHKNKLIAGCSASDVKVDAEYSSGIKIASISANSVGTDIYVPPQSMVPDWDSFKQQVVDLTNGILTRTSSSNIYKSNLYTAEEDGYILNKYISNSYSNHCSSHLNNSYYVNGLLVANGHSYGFQQEADSGWHSINNIIIPMAKGDILSCYCYDNIDAWGSSTAQISNLMLYRTYFYPCKESAVAADDCVSYVIETKHGVESDGNRWWYRIYSDGFIEQGGYCNKIDSLTDYEITFPKPISSSKILSINGTSVGYGTSPELPSTYISLVLTHDSNGNVIGAVGRTWNAFTTENPVPVCWRVEGFV